MTTPSAEPLSWARDLVVELRGLVADARKGIADSVDERDRLDAQLALAREEVERLQVGLDRARRETVGAEEEAARAEAERDRSSQALAAARIETHAELERAARALAAERARAAELEAQRDRLSAEAAALSSPPARDPAAESRDAAEREAAAPNADVDLGSDEDSEAERVDGADDPSTDTDPAPPGGRRRGGELREALTGSMHGSPRSRPRLMALIGGADAPPRT